MKKRKLSTKVILVVVFFALLIIVATCLSVVLRYRKDIMERYSSQGFAYARVDKVKCRHIRANPVYKLHRSFR